MNDADFELLKADASADNPAVLQAVLRIQRDLSIMMEKVNRIEESIMVPPGGWDRDEDVELSDPPF